MRKELIGILFFFLAIFILISLLSYSPSDPSVHHAKSADHIHNLFGLPGAYLAGILIGFSGLGAFCVPGAFLFSSIRFFGNPQRKAILKSVGGGILLAVTTGSLLAFRQHHYLIFGNSITAGGIIGTPLKSVLIKYSTFTGGGIILALMWIIGFALAAGISLTPPVVFAQRCQKAILGAVNRMKALFIIWREQRKRAKRRLK